MLVERDLAKVEAAGSSPAYSSVNLTYPYAVHADGFPGCTEQGRLSLNSPLARIVQWQNFCFVSR